MINKTQNNPLEFRALPTTKKGDIGEQFAIKYLEEKGYQVWWNTGNQSQVYDGFANSGTTVRNLVEVKVKYPAKNGYMSIHQNDLIKYLEAEQTEGRQMIILYLDYMNGDVNVITPKSIVKNTIGISKDHEDHKKLVYFSGWTKRGDIPEDVCEQIKLIV